MMKLIVRKQLYVALCAYLGQVLVSFGNSWPIPMIAKLMDNDETPLPQAMDYVEMSILTSIFFGGYAAGPYLCGFLSNRKGRKPCFYIGGTLCILAFSLLASARNLVLMYVGRTCMGFGTGIITAGNIIYLGEIASVNTRGFLLTAFGVFNGIGFMLMAVFGLYTPYVATHTIGIWLSVCYLTGLYLIPESPVYFMMNGSEEKLKNSLRSLGRDDEIDTMIAQKNKLELKRKRDDWLDIIRIKSNRNAFIITLILSLLQQFAGMAAGVFFADTLFDLVGISVSPLVTALATSMPQFFASCVTPFFIEIIGRRSLLLISTSSCALSLAIMGTYLFIDLWTKPVLSFVWIPLIILTNFFLSTELGFNKIPQVFMGEMFTPHVRSTGTAVVLSISSLFGYTITITFGYLLQLGAHIPFWIYALSSAVAFVFTIFIVPETKGKTLVEIQEMLDKGGLIRQR